MRWFRSHRGFGAQAALFALAIQFVLAFGHFHAAGENHDAAASAVGFNLAGSPSNDGPQEPAGHDCAICATIHLTGSGQAAACPSLPLLVLYPIAKLALSSESFSDDHSCFEPRSRGPPQA